MKKYFFIAALCVFALACKKNDTNHQSLDTLAVQETFAPDIISSSTESENIISFSPDGLSAIFTRTDDWINQTPYISTYQDGKWTMPTQMDFADNIYNIRFSEDGNAILYSVRNDDADTTSIWMMTKTDDGWSAAQNLTMLYDIAGSYPWLQADGTLYYYWNINNGDIFKTKLTDGNREDIVRLPEPINTIEGNEFSPFVGPDNGYLLFTRYTKGDITQQGIFKSDNTATAENPIWSKPYKLDLPYGWGASVSPDQQTLYYTNGEDIFAVNAMDVFPSSTIPLED